MLHVTKADMRSACMPRALYELYSDPIGRGCLLIVIFLASHLHVVAGSALAALYCIGEYDVYSARCKYFLGEKE